MALLEVEDLHTYYGNIHALKRGLARRSSEGEIVALIGANGAGKSTTLNTISGLVRPRHGLGPPRRPGPRRRASRTRSSTMGVVQVPEGRRMFARLTVQENLRMGGYTLARQGGRQGRHRARVRAVPAAQGAPARRSPAR